QGHGRRERDCAERRSEVDSSHMIPRRGVARVAVLVALLVPATLAAQSGAFIVRLGRDTLALERYARTAGRLEGEQVARAPRTVPATPRPCCRSATPSRGR